jgi:hypothetical protein
MKAPKYAKLTAFDAAWPVMFILMLPFSVTVSFSLPDAAPTDVTE